MATTATTEGRRRADGTDVADLMAGDYCQRGSRWWCCTPNGMMGNLERHEVTEHPDGTITVSPSILVAGERSWHGYLERGVWREI